MGVSHIVAKQGGIYSGKEGYILGGGGRIYMFKGGGVYSEKDG